MAKVMKKAEVGDKVPKGYVRGERSEGKLYKKADQDKWEAGMADALDKQAGLGKYAKKAVAKVKPKAKDGKWIQKAINPKHKGYCTPMTKATCTPKRKALAMTLKKMGKARKGK